jgi:[protein-PII] uridylyltransferase
MAMHWIVLWFESLICLNLISVAQDFARHLSSHTALPALRPARLSRRAQFFPIHPQVFLQAEEGKNHTDRPGAWLSITASDRPGLLYTIAHVLATLEINIEFAKITTLGERAEDHFFISGLALHTQSTWVNLETALLRVLEPHVGTGYLIQSNVK